MIRLMLSALSGKKSDEAKPAASAPNGKKHLPVHLTEQKLMAIWAGTIMEMKHLQARTLSVNAQINNDYARLKEAYGKLAEENKKLKRQVERGRTV